MEDCIFCKIINKEIPASTVYEDDQFLAFLDINPVTDGHLLLIPKAHHQMMIDLPDDLLGEIYIKAKELMPALKKAMKADFVALLVVGIDVPHFHIHLIPRKLDDGLADFWPTKKYVEGEAMKIVEKIKSELPS
ncbi:MAG: HIT family protein [Candidatus Buchananbacteria bacterium]|nr:HIT family protein [Candidatus Buchananbacteria bacterium]